MRQPLIVYFGPAAWLQKGVLTMAQEIERKWLIGRVPSEQELSAYTAREIVQGYLCTDPVIRIRRDADSFYMTYKGKGMLVREEYNLPLTKEAYEQLLKKCDGYVLRKTRYMIPAEEGNPAGCNRYIELDIFHGDYEGLCYAEVEFASEEKADAYRPPAWFGREVTLEPAYSNAALSRGSLKQKVGMKYNRTAEI